ncbi:hypothetical protein [Hymenobacter sediminicola]|uniref:Ig-like domain-containing protein n=1 Tax=Hymenobacter sediminicola TaxID=2761579 RepID=A0A7G7W3Y5_9BACT|nr:hypothetical protein [Hymenobacter sediminicola]QNH61078.1 hypothetical protein H4317_12945 [Hymenobacter sediminicola]
MEQPDIAVWPDEHSITSIQPRQLFLFSAGSRTNGRRDLPDFGRRIQVYLWSKHDSVPLLLLDQPANPLSSDLQVLMQPARPLLPDTVYHLRTSLPYVGYWLFRMQRARAGSNQLVIAHRWRVSSAPPDTQAPRWTATPSVMHKEYSSNSEGINNFVQFSNSVLDASPVLVRATIRSARHAKPVVSYLTPWDNLLGIGWFSCSGNFTFGPSEDCTVTFEALDAAGNRSLATSHPLPFQAPIRPG